MTNPWTANPHSPNHITLFSSLATSREAAMRTLSCLLLLAALVGAASAFSLVDPSEVVDQLSHSAGLEKWKKPDFCGCASQPDSTGGRRQRHPTARLLCLASACQRAPTNHSQPALTRSSHAPITSRGPSPPTVSAANERRSTSITARRPSLATLNCHHTACRDSDCPPFKVKEHTDNYEIREYEAGKPGVLPASTVCTTSCWLSDALQVCASGCLMH